MTTVTGNPLPLSGMPSPTPPPALEQLVLIGAPQPIRVPERLWRTWLDDPVVVARFEAKRYRRQENLCSIWIAGVSSTGHGSFRAASLPGPSRRGTVPAHLFAYQLEYGIIPRLGWSGADDAVLCHQCDFADCTNPTICAWAPTAQTATSTTCAGATLPARCRMSAARPAAPAPSPQPSAPAWPTTKIPRPSNPGSETPKPPDPRSRCGDDRRQFPDPDSV